MIKTIVKIHHGGRIRTKPLIKIVSYTSTISGEVLSTRYILHIPLTFSVADDYQIYGLFTYTTWDSAKDHYVDFMKESCGINL